jgi:glucan phosphorylase
MKNLIKPSFDHWWVEVVKLAAKQDVLWMLGDKQDHLAGYSDGNSPADEIYEMMQSVDQDDC